MEREEQSKKKARPGSDSSQRTLLGFFSRKRKHTDRPEPNITELQDENRPSCERVQESTIVLKDNAQNPSTTEETTPLTSTDGVCENAIVIEDNSQNSNNMEENSPLTTKLVFFTIKN